MSKVGLTTCFCVEFSLWFLLLGLFVRFACSFGELVLWVCVACYWLRWLSCLLMLGGYVSWCCSGVFVCCLVALCVRVVGADGRVRCVLLVLVCGGLGLLCYVVVLLGCVGLIACGYWCGVEFAILWLSVKWSGLWGLRG